MLKNVLQQLFENSKSVSYFFRFSCRLNFIINLIIVSSLSDSLYFTPFKPNYSAIPWLQYFKTGPIGSKFSILYHFALPLTLIIMVFVCVSVLNPTVWTVGTAAFIYPLNAHALACVCDVPEECTTTSGDRQSETDDLRVSPVRVGPQKSCRNSVVFVMFFDASGIPSETQIQTSQCRKCL